MSARSTEAKTFTRAELYDLVWSRTRTALANELGLSDVAITKHCKAALIPTPPMGYWAKLNAGRKPKRIALPSRLPGQTDTFLMGGGPHSWRWPAADNLTDEPTPPRFSENLDEQVAAVVKRVGRVVITRDLSSPDPALTKVVEAEAKRRVESQTDKWNSHKPRFDEPVFQRHLRIFNSIARALQPVYGIQYVGERDEWVQGRGTLHHLMLHLNFGGSGLSLRVHEPGEPRRDRGPKPVAVSTLRVEAGAYEEQVLEWSDRAGSKLESRLTEIVGALVRRAEERLRTHEQQDYERLRRRWQEERDAIERQRVEAERKRLAAIAARQAKLRDEVIDLAKRQRMAEDIRATVAAFRLHPEVSATGGSARFEAWVAHALAVADGIDPMKSSLEELMGSFSVAE